MAAAEKLFHCYAAVIGWHDGDTCYAVLDQGNLIFRAGGMKIDYVEDEPRVVLETIRHRAALIQAPEINKPGGPEALAYAMTIAPPAIYPVITYKGPEPSFGRPLIDIILDDGRRFSDAMISARHAIFYRRK